MQQSQRVQRVLVANRGEIAIRVFRTAQALGMGTVAVAPEDDAGALHLRRADQTVTLPGRGAAAYLDAAAVVAACGQAGADALHPGYGFLSERAALAEACAAAGVRFVGPDPATLARLGDKAAARALARSCGVAVVPGTEGTVDVRGAAAFLASLGEGGAIMLKAAAGGGGRGMRAVTDPAALADAFERCRSEAAAAFGDGALYAEQLVRRARHIEVQVIGDGTGAALSLGERECSLQRRNQKVVELAPALPLPAATLAGLHDAAVTMARAISYRSLGTFEFLVDADDPTWFAFIEANARLQVEHTVTEEVTGLDLVALQLELAGGATLAELGLDGAAAVPAPRGRAVQLRINSETMAADGSVKPGGGTVVGFEAPTGPGLRVDTAVAAGVSVHPGFDSLLAKVICHTARDDVAALLRIARRALGELRVDGVPTNAAFLQALLEHPAIAEGSPPDTGFVEAHAAELVAVADARAATYRTAATGAAVRTTRRAAVEVPFGQTAVPAPMQGTVVSVAVTPGDVVRAGAEVAVLEAMKMEHVLAAPCAGIVRSVVVGAGDTLYEGEILVLIEEADVGDTGEVAATAVDLDR
ncbi:MAG: biotin carboxylase N-terminal domain-containing protein, partial [Acidimicrobiia bacterium]